MSDTELHIGKLKEINPKEEESFENLMLRILEENGKGTERSSYCKNTLEWFNEELRKSHFAYKEKVYELQDEELDEYADLIKAKKEENGEISYHLKFYNGGTCFKECLEEALDKLK